MTNLDDVLKAAHRDTPARFSQLTTLLAGQRIDERVAVEAGLAMLAPDSAAALGLLPLDSIVAELRDSEGETVAALVVPAGAVRLIARRKRRSRG